MTVPQHRLPFFGLLRRIRTIVRFWPIEVQNPTGTVITVPYGFPKQKKYRTPVERSHLPQGLGRNAFKAFHTSFGTAASIGMILPQNPSAVNFASACKNTCIFRGVRYNRVEFIDGRRSIPAAADSKGDPPL